MVQLSDALQYAWAQIPSRHVIVPSINPTKTWEGLLGGSASVTLIGGVLWWATPFQGSNWWMAAAMSLVISVMGFAGGLTLSAIKRDRGVRDYGTLVEGHGGLLDRIDSLCFSAPVFFHFTLYWLKMQGVKQPWEVSFILFPSTNVSTLFSFLIHPCHHGPRVGRVQHAAVPGVNRLDAAGVVTMVGA